MISEPYVRLLGKVIVRSLDVQGLRDSKFVTSCVRFVIDLSGATGGAPLTGANCHTRAKVAKRRLALMLLFIPCL